jgi:hypothetical protein
MRLRAEAVRVYRIWRIACSTTNAALSRSVRIRLHAIPLGVITAKALNDLISWKEVDRYLRPDQVLIPKNDDEREIMSAVVAPTACCAAPT